ncbi:MAG: hypothetical protein KC506_01300 [Nanoarchaeota archaeon]|nr:hypothetical protein [Nanoarchaeota archaeon]
MAVESKWSEARRRQLLSDPTNARIIKEIQRQKEVEDQQYEAEMRAYSEKGWWQRFLSGEPYNSGPGYDAVHSNTPLSRANFDSRIDELQAAGVVGFNTSDTTYRRAHVWICDEEH